MSPPAPLPPLAPGALPLAGHFIAYRQDPLGFLMNLAARGRIVGMRLGPIEAFLLREPEDIDRVLVSEHRRFWKDRMTRGLGRVLGDGLLTSEGDIWLRHRRLLAPAFHRERIAAYGNDMALAADRFARSLQPGEVRDIHADMMRLTLEIVAKALFDSDVGPRAADVAHALDVVVGRFGDGSITLFPWLEHLPLPSNRRSRDAIATLDDVLLGVVRARRARGGGGSDLLSMLLAAEDDAGRGLSDREMRDELMTLFLAGHETTALALSYAFVLLSKHPDVEARLRAESDAVLGNTLPTTEHLARLPFARAVILETLRLYPPAWAIGREAIEETSLAGYRIPKGTQLWISQWVNHRDARYFPEPERFLPDRWLGGLERSLPRFAYYPFGGGPRICIGNQFSLLEATIVLATILRRVRVRLLERRPLSLLPMITLRPQDPIVVAYEPAPKPELLRAPVSAAP
ncbi:cytochrome P450 [Polyangium sorediatum]|uniref:Cytochrome P450 n=1 Tax=Polyangium sorediatum TaxID=889274 RepID=A0ABT6P8G9_9BACT|nr:cytochrome P450 [Polyangium sorediatum]MDI1436901.1 cytochrome P450 [Polyangium sorediatum]